VEKMQEMCGFVAGVLSLAAFVPYIISILKGVTKPSRASWIIWLVVGVLLLSSYRTSGAKFTLWMPISYVIGPIIVVCLSIKHSTGGWSKFDIFCLSLAAGSLIVWFISESAALALAMHLIIDAMGVLPTVKKAYSNPKEENKTTWMMLFVGSILNFLAIDSLNLMKMAYPSYMLIGNGIIFLLVAFPQKKLDQ
jgi:hypothetical protein